MALGPGVRFGQYEIISPLGMGGMGEVYRAKDTRLERIVAIKILPAGILLGLSYSSTGESVLSSQSAMRAWQWRDRVSDRERFFIDFT